MSITATGGGGITIGCATEGGMYPYYWGGGIIGLLLVIVLILLVFRLL
jgi:hypothetical protein